MKIYPKPEQTVFAEAAHEGEIQSFPDIARGWGKSLDLTGGIPPMEWFNALGKRSDEAIRYLTQRGISEWSASESYPQGAVSYFNQQLWFALSDNQNSQPQQGAIWQRISFTEQQIKQLIPVRSVNGKTGDVQLSAEDVGALTQQQGDQLYLSGQMMANLLALTNNQIDLMHRQLELKTELYKLEPQTMPVGSPIPWPCSAPPTGFLICDGSRFSLLKYPLLARAYPRMGCW